ncbi:MAG: amidase family protein, partial [Terriglobales bacterium]
MDLNSLTISGVRNVIAEGKTSAAALAEAFYAKINAEDGDVHAYLTLCRERALAQAERVDRMAKRGQPLPPLAGVPVAIKDVILTR